MLPGSSGSGSGKVELILSVELDPNSVQKTTAQAKTAQEQISKALSGTVTPAAQAAGGFAPGTAYDYSKSAQEVQQLIDSRKRVAELGKKALAEYDNQIGRSSKSVEQLEAEITSMFSKSAKGAEQNSREFERFEGQSKQLARGMMKVADVVQITATMVAAMGAAISAVAFKDIQAYIKSGVDANNITIGWENQSHKVEDANLRIGKVLTTTLLPAYEAVANIVSKIATFAEAHPETAAGVAVGGLVLGVLGGLVALAATGIRVYADITFASATSLQVASARGHLTAADKFLISAGLHQSAADTELKAAGIEAAAAEGKVAASTAGGAGIGTMLFGPAAAGAGNVIGGIASAIASIATGIIAPLLAAALAANLTRQGINQARGTSTTFADIQRTDIEGSAIAINAVLSTLNKGISALGIQTGATSESIWDTAKSLAGLKESTEQVTAATREQLSATQQAQLNSQRVTAWIGYQKQEQRAAEDNQKQINQIRADGAKREQQIAAQNAEAIAQINSQFAQQVAEAWASYNLSDRRAWEDYQRQRAQIIADGDERIQEIERENQKRLAEMEYDHSVRIYDLASARDALGLAREQRQYEHDRQQQIENTNEQIAQTRRDLAARLKQQAEEFRIQSERRWEDFQLQLAEMQRQKEERLAQQRKEFEEQNKAAATQEQERIDQAKENYRSEKQRRAEDFGDQMIQLNNAFYDQEMRRSEWYNRAVQQADTWMKVWAEYMDPSRYLNPQVPLSGPLNPHTRQIGGYARFIGSGENGIPEFVMSSQTTSAAEKIIGGKLNQQNLMQALLRGNEGRGSITWNDYRRFDGDVGEATRRIIASDTRKILEELLQ